MIHLVGADDGGGAERFDGLEVLDEAVLFGHALGRQRQADRHRGQQTLGHVGHDDADQEDHRLQPLRRPKRPC